MMMPARICILAVVAAACSSCVMAAREDGAQRAGGVTVYAYWQGGTAAETAELLAAPIERGLTAIKGVASTFTRCDATSCSILLEYEPAISSYDIAFEASAVVKRMRDKLPAGARAVVYATNAERPADLVLALVLDAKELKAERHTAALEFAHAVMQFPGASRYEIPGAPQEETVVDIDPVRAKPYGIDAAEIARAIEKEVVTIDEYTRILIGTRPGAKGDVGSILIKTAGNAAVRVRDVATITKVMTPALVHRLNGEPVILVNVFLRSGATPPELRGCIEHIQKLRRSPLIKRVAVLTQQ